MNFAIIDRITITAPNTAVTWTIGSTRSITWTHNLGAAAAVDIDVSRDGGGDLELDRRERPQRRRHHGDLQAGW